MFGGSGRNGFALGLVIGVGLTFALCVWLIGPDYQTWLDHNGVLVETKDTLAQWVMALIGLIATGISLYAVFLIKDTLTQTIQTNQAAVAAANAANEANRIMRSEQRPWVTLQREAYCDVQISDRGIYLEWTFDLVNKGRSPAYDVAVHYEAIRRPHFQQMWEQLKTFSAHCIEHRRGIRNPVIFPGETTSFISPHRGGFSYRSDKGSITSGHPMLIVCVTYRLSLELDDKGVEACIFGFDPDDESNEPVRAKMLEYNTARYIQ
jgi:hypothetical protein